MKWLFKSSIAKSLIGSFIIVIVPVIIINLIVNYMSMNIVREKVNESFNNSVSLLSDQLNNDLSKFSLMAKNLYINDDITSIAQAPDMPQVLWDYVDLIKMMEFYSSTNGLDANILVYMKTKNKVFSSVSGLDDIDSKEFEKAYKEYTNGNWVFKKGFGADKKVLAFVTGILSGKWLNETAVVIEIDQTEIEQLLKNLRVKEGGTAFILSEDGYAVTANKHPGIDFSSFVQTISAQKSQEGQFIYHQQDLRYQVLYNRLEGTGLSLGVYFPEDQVMEPILRIRTLIIGILIISVGLAMFFTFFSYRNLLLPVHRLVDAMKKVRKGDLKARVDEGGSSELGFMLKQFNIMAAQIDSLFNEVYAERLKTQQAQLKFLQSQINPHFLYNCLYYIYDVSKGENTEAAADMAMYLGEYFRYATRSNQETVSLKEELDNIKAYINIQKMRYPAKIDFHMETEDQADDITIPRLIMQPLVENAIIHGMEKVARKGCIWIKVECHSEFLKIIVEDDGDGISLERLEEIRKEMDDLDKKTGSYGLSNSHWRLKLKYGEMAGIHIEQRDPRGTKVTAVIPV